jgi:4-hydroxy-2-oxovalerate aldolase
MGNKQKVAILDTTLRDGQHAMAHQFTPQQAADVAKALDEAGVGTIEISHGDGLAGSSIQYGFAAADDFELLQAASKVTTPGKIGVLLLPGVGTQEDLQMAKECGAGAARVATHCTEADIAEQHIDLARQLGMRPIGVLMMTHMVDPPKLVEQAKIMEASGAELVYMMDSAGAMLPPEVIARVDALKSALDVQVGFHAHNNLSMAVANTLAAIEAGADSVDGCLRGLGAGSGNAQLEVLIGVLERMGVETGVDFYEIMDAAEKVVEPLMHRPQVINNDGLMLGYAGVYSSFLLHARRAAARFDVDIRDVLVELGQRKTVGGQEDMIIDVAIEMAKETGKLQ